MRLQDYVVKITGEAMTEAFNYAKAVPEGKRDWKPLDMGQSVLSMTRELAKCPDWALAILEGGEMELEAGETAADEMNAWATIEQCEAVCKQKLTRYCAFIADYPDAKLTETKNLPFGEGGTMRTFTMLEMMDYPRWNASYHQGQIAYIQTLYGDKDNH